MSIGPPEKKDFGRWVVERLREAGFVALWAGGCVRDMSLGCEPKDYDVATDAVPEQVRDLFGHRHTLAIGAAFGVVAVRGPRGAGQVEVATFRQDHGYSNGRRPDSVSFSSPEEDAKRRDFTINGMFYDPITDRTIDYVSGAADIAAGVVRAIGDPDQRFAEDKLRMLRAVRFATTLGFRLESHTAESIVRHASQIVVVSGERIAVELERMLRATQRGLAMQMLRDTGLLVHVLPEMPSLESESKSRSPSLAWIAKRKLLDSLVQPTWAVVLAAIFHDSPSHDEEASAGNLRKACRRLRLSNAITDRAIWLLRSESIIRRSRQNAWPRVQALLIHPGRDELLALAEAIARDRSVEEEEGVVFCREKRELPESDLNPAPLIRGDDLLELGIPCGPQFGQWLSQVRNAQLDHRIHTREEALEWVAQRQAEMEDEK